MQQLISLLEKHGMTGSTLPAKNFLQLKTGVTWVGENTLVAAGEFLTCPELQDFNISPVLPEEQGVANCISINGKIIMLAGFPQTIKLLNQFASEVIERNISGFAKIDGGLICLSLRF